MESQNASLELTLQKISRPNYKTLRLALKSQSSRFNHLHDDSDLKKMNSVLALEIIYWFLEEVYNIKKDDLLATYPNDFSVLTQLPHPVSSESCFRLFNANILFFQGMAEINQHIPFNFEMILRPEDYADEWKLVISQILDYLSFKQILEPKHLALKNLLEESETNLQHKQNLLESAKTDL